MQDMEYHFRSRSLLIGFFCIIFSLPLLCIPELMTEKLAQLLPKSFLVKSAGSYYPGFSHPNGFAHQLFRIGMLLILTPFALFLGLLCPKDNLRLSRRLRYSLIIPTTIAVALFYYQLAMPPMFSPSNARMLWVEPLVFGSKFWSSYPLLCILHRVFYDFPGLLVSGSALVVFALCFLIARELLLSWEMSFLTALALVFSSPMLNFATVAEGVLPNIGVLCLAVYLYLRFGGVSAGVGVFLASLGRPQFLSLLPAILLAEFISSLRSTHHSSWISFFSRNSALLRLLATFAILYLAWQAFALSQGFSLFYNHGTASTELLANSMPKSIDGFEISSFSGAYFGHFWWQFPTLVVMLWMVSLLDIWKLHDRQTRFIVLGTAVLLCNLCFHEAFPIFYFNHRYITYYYPLIHISAFITLVRYSTPHWSASVFLGLLLAASAVAPYTTAFESSRKAENSPLISLYENREILREWANGRTVVSIPLDWRTKNYLAYIFRSHTTIQEASNAAPLDDGLYILAEIPAQGCSEVLYLNKLYFCRLHTGTLKH